jgi:hypothetical protein
VPYFEGEIMWHVGLTSAQLWVQTEHLKQYKLLTAPMALDRSKASILEKGYLIFKDPAIGNVAEDFIQKNYPFQTIHGPKVMKASIFDYKVSNN